MLGKLFRALFKPKAEKADADITERIQDTTHIVSAGETVQSIAELYYATAGRAPVIIDANRKLIGEGERMYSGQVLVIPAG